MVIAGTLEAGDIQPRVTLVREPSLSCCGASCAQPATTSTTTPTTTTQPPPPPCGDAPTPYAAAACRIARLRERLEGASPGELGGKPTANRLRASLRQATRFLDAAQSGKKVAANLRRALRQVTSFEKTVAQGLVRKQRQIDPEVGETMLSLSTDARSGIGVLQANAL